MKNRSDNTIMLEEEKKFQDKISDKPIDEQLPRSNSSNLSTTDDGSSLRSIATPPGQAITKTISNIK